MHRQSVRRISRRGVKEFLALCSTLKLYSLQFEEVPVMPPGGNVKYYALWRMERFRGRTKDPSAISRIAFR